MPITDFDKEHIEDVLADVHGKEYNWFTCYLLRLISKADLENRSKLRLVYPAEVKAYEEWVISNFGSRRRNIQSE